MSQTKVRTSALQIIPATDFILLRLQSPPPPETTQGGIVVAQNDADKVSYGRVEGVGPKVSGVVKDDVIAFVDSYGYQVGGHDQLLVRETEVLATIRS